MKSIYLFLFLFVLSCSSANKAYVCGDHLCVDKKEFNEYFSKNLIIEIELQQKKKMKNSDLVKLNTDTSNKKKKVNTSFKKKEQSRLKDEKKKIKALKKRLLEERKIKKAEEKNKKKIANIKASNSRKQFKSSDVKLSGKNKKNNKMPINKEIVTETSVTKKTKSICNKIKDCDIDKIAEMLIKKGKDKPFPNIASN